MKKYLPAFALLIVAVLCVTYFYRDERKPYVCVLIECDALGNVKPIMYNTFKDTTTAYIEYNDVITKRMKQYCQYYVQIDTTDDVQIEALSNLFLSDYIILCMEINPISNNIIYPTNDIFVSDSLVYDFIYRNYKSFNSQLIYDSTDSYQFDEFCSLKRLLKKLKYDCVSDSVLSVI